MENIPETANAFSVDVQLLKIDTLDKLFTAFESVIYKSLGQSKKLHDKAITLWSQKVWGDMCKADVVTVNVYWWIDKDGMKFSSDYLYASPKVGTLTSGELQK